MNQKAVFGIVQLRASHHRDHQDRRIVTTEIAAS
jgi:hypothetical protein